jgi:SAM-dependent methyltransferase
LSTTTQFICPHCNHSINAKEDGYLCTDCGKLYDFSKGYLDLLGQVDFYAGEATQADMQSLINDIDLYGYEHGLEKLYEKYPYLRDYISDIRRSDWLSHCIGKSKFRALDIGSGLGNLSEMLSYTFHQVYSLEAVRERIEFQVRRFRNANRSNITLIRGNAIRLPFPDNYFDLVVCNGVLEWIGSMNRSLNPREGQISFLREIKRVLSHSGCLYIGIENRFGLWFLLGAKDHSGLPYTSLIPRKAADILVRKYGNVGGIYGDKSKRRKENKGYYEYTYSKWGYCKLFDEVGFNYRTFWTYPSYNRPFFSGRIDDKVGLKGFIKYLRLTTTKHRKILSVLGKVDSSLLAFLASLITPSFLFFCYKNEFQEVIDDSIVKQSMLKSYTVLSGGYTVMYLMYNKKGEARSIAHLKRYKYELPDRIPVVDKSSGPKSAVNSGIWLENWLPGRRLNPNDLEEVGMAIEWLISFQIKNRSLKMYAKDIVNEIDFIKQSISQLHEFKRNEYMTLLDEYVSYISGFRIYRTAEHGDFWHGNIIYDTKAHKVNVIDWEYFRETGNPFYDFVFFVLNGMLGPNDSEEQFRLNLKHSGTFAAIMKDIQSKMRSHFGFDVDLIKILPYVIMRFVSTKYTERKVQDKSVINFEKTMDKQKRLLEILIQSQKK